MLKLRIRGRLATHEYIHIVERDYPLGHYDRTLLWIGPDFVEPVDDDVPMNVELRMRDFDMSQRRRIQMTHI